MQFDLSDPTTYYGVVNGHVISNNLGNPIPESRFREGRLYLCTGSPRKFTSLAEAVAFAESASPGEFAPVETVEEAEPVEPVAVEEPVEEVVEEQAAEEPEVGEELE